MTCPHCDKNEKKTAQATGGPRFKTTFWPVALAVRLAAEAQADDAAASIAGYTYRATNPDGAHGPLSAIEVLDSDGAIVGTL